MSVKKYKILQNTRELVNEKACIASKNMSLDILRIVAALMVLMVHVGQWTGLNKWTDVGAKGVPLFFILSGYLAMASCHRIFSMDGTVKDYYIGRAKRILPMYYWALFLDYIYSIYICIIVKDLTLLKFLIFFMVLVESGILGMCFSCNMYYHQIILHGGIIDLRYGQ